MMNANDNRRACPCFGQTFELKGPQGQVFTVARKNPRIARHSGDPNRRRQRNFSGPDAG